MIQVAIAEDDVSCSRQLQNYLQRLGREIGRSFHITTYSNGEDLVEHYESSFDLILMDVEMPYMNGMDAARYIRHMDQRVIILFVTSLAQYAIQGYAVQALDYLLKPLAYGSFSPRLKHALTFLDRQKECYLTASVKGGAIRLSTSSIYYIERQSYQLVIHAQDGVYTTKGALQEVEERLTGQGFFRCNQGCLVNLAFVDGIQDGCALVCKDHLPISRIRKKEFLSALNQYIGEVVF